LLLLLRQLPLGDLACAVEEHLLCTLLATSDVLLDLVHVLLVLNEVFLLLGIIITQNELPLLLHQVHNFA